MTAEIKLLTLRGFPVALTLHQDVDELPDPETMHHIVTVAEAGLPANAPDDAIVPVHVLIAPDLEHIDCAIALLHSVTQALVQMRMAGAFASNDETPN